MDVIGTLILTTALAGVAGTGLGGLIGAMLQKDSNRVVSLLLSFAGGVMLSVVCFDLVTEAIGTGMGIWTVVGAVAFGVAVTFLLNHLIDRKTNPEVPHIDADHPKTADDLDELIHSDHLEQHYARKDSKLGLFVAGVGGTGLGGLIGAILQKDSKRTVSLLLSFAGGVMLSVVCFDLVTEAIETNMGIWFVVGAIAFGVAVTYYLNYLIDRKTNPEVAHIDENHPKTADDLDELIHSDHLQTHQDRKDGRLGLFVAGVVMA
ncbi:MAG: hypothetical protein II320_05895, partial [Oscillospiraceae bacterium]|nr:hypothetical protein [Oscillospiraceae bacterium]